MKKSKFLLILFFLLGTSGRCFSKSGIDKEYIERGKHRLSELIRQNALNDAAGKSHLNRYVFSLSESRLTFEEGNVKNRVAKSGFAFVSPAAVNELNVYLHELAEDGLYLYAGLDGRRFEIQKSGTAHLSGERKDITNEIKLLNNLIYKGLIENEDTITNQRAFVSLHPILRYYISDPKKEPSKKDSVQRLYYKHVIHNPIAHNGIAPLVVETGNGISIRKKTADQDVLYFVKTIGELFRTYEPVEDSIEVAEDLPCRELLIEYMEKGHPYATDSSNYFFRSVHKNPCLLEGMVNRFGIPPTLEKRADDFYYPKESVLLKQTESKRNSQKSQDIEMLAGELRRLMSSEHEFVSNQGGVSADNQGVEDHWDVLLNEKFLTYKQVTGKEFYALTTVIDYYLTDSDKEDFAQKVLQQAGADASKVTLVLDLVFPAKKLDIGLNGDRVQSVTVINYSNYLTSIQGFHKENLSLPEKEHFYQKTLEVYKQMPKPYYSYRYFVYLDHFEYKLVEEPEYIAGKCDCINELLVYYDEEGFSAVEVAWEELKKESSSNGVMDGLSAQNDGDLSMLDFGALYDAYEKFTTSWEEAVNTTSRIDETNAPVRPHRLRESFIRENHASFFQVYFLDKWSDYFDPLHHVGGYAAFEGKLYPVNMDEWVYLAVDALSVLPYADTPLELFGLIYAIFDHDGANAANYTIGVLAVGINTRITKKAYAAFFNNGERFIYLNNTSGKITAFTRTDKALISENVKDFLTVNNSTAEKIAQHSKGSELFSNKNRAYLKQFSGNERKQIFEEAADKNELDKLFTDINGKKLIVPVISGLPAAFEGKITAELYKKLKGYQITDDWLIGVLDKGVDPNKLDNVLGELLVKATDGKAAVLALIEALPANKFEGVFEKISGFSEEATVQLFRRLLNEKHGNATGSFLKDHLDDIDEEILEAWNECYKSGKFPDKKYDYAFLDDNRGNTIDDFTNLSNRLKKATEYDEPFKTWLIDAASRYRSKLVNDVHNLFTSVKGSKLDEYILLYKNDEVLTEKMLELKRKTEHGETLTKEAIRQTFKGYHAHHIIPVNLIWNSKTLREILIWAHQNGKVFDFNTLDNLFFLKEINHLPNGIRSHTLYDKFILKEIEGLRGIVEENEMEEAFEGLMSVINEAGELFKKEFIGTTKNIDIIN